MKMVLSISRKLEAVNRGSEIYSCHTLKPFDNIRLKIFNNFKKYSYLGRSFLYWRPF